MLIAHHRALSSVNLQIDPIVCTHTGMRAGLPQPGIASLPPAPLPRSEAYRQLEQDRPHDQKQHRRKNERAGGQHHLHRSFGSALF